MSLKITTLIENSQDNEKNLFYEHGLSLYIELDDKKFLFDTGQTGDFINNAKTLNKSLDDLDYVFLSHGHYDHSGGVKRLVPFLNKNTQFFLGKEFFRPKYKIINESEYKYNGNSFDKDFLVSQGFSINMIDQDVIHINDKLIVFHNFYKTSDYEKIKGKFYIKEADQYIKDDFLDEIAIGIITEKGLVVIVGCSHIGIINILSTIKKRTNTDIYYVIGGTHMIEADNKRIEKTICDLDKLGVKNIAVSHCTGECASNIFMNRFGDRFIANNTGNIIKL